MVDLKDIMDQGLLLDIKKGGPTAEKSTQTSEEVISLIGSTDPKQHSHTFDSITGKPIEYPPSAHTHGQYLDSTPKLYQNNDCDDLTGINNLETMLVNSDTANKPSNYEKPSTPELEGVVTCVVHNGTINQIFTAEGNAEPMRRVSNTNGGLGTWQRAPVLCIGATDMAQYSFIDKFPTNLADGVVFEQHSSRGGDCSVWCDMTKSGNVAFDYHDNRFTQFDQRTRTILFYTSTYDWNSFGNGIFISVIYQDNNNYLGIKMVNETTYQLNQRADGNIPVTQNYNFPRVVTPQDEVSIKFEYVATESGSITIYFNNSQIQQFNVPLDGGRPAISGSGSIGAGELFNDWNIIIG